MAISIAGKTVSRRIMSSIFGAIFLLAVSGSQAAQVNWNGPAGSVAFGQAIAVLPNGNIVVTDPCDLSGGAAYLYSPNQTQISKVTGISPGYVPSNCSTPVADTSIKIVVLKNGNYLIANASWKSGSTSNLGMVAWASRTSGLSGIISASNALVGTSSGDNIGSGGITVLANGNYVIGSGSWKNGTMASVGAATWSNGSSGVVGQVSVVNSLVGTNAGDGVGSKIIALTNSNYVVSTFNWGNYAGAYTWGNGTTGTNGEVSEANSLVGSNYADGFKSSVVALSNGNYVVANGYWDNGGEQNTGAVTWGNGTTGIAGRISASNSLIGGKSGNYVGYPLVVPLTNGNYVVSSSDWEGASGINRGAVTWANGNTGLTGVVSAVNSLIGDFDYEFVGAAPPYRNENVMALANGNYVVSTPFWGNGQKQHLGAITWGNGTVGTVGIVSASNSLTGSTQEDLVGLTGSLKITPLTNGNYVVISAKWQNEEGVAVGAATWVDGSAPHSGLVSSSNSVPGVSSVIALSNGDFVVSSREWVTRGNGATGTTGALALDTALAVDGYSVPLADGSYLVCSLGRDNGAISAAGSITWSAASTAVVGEVTVANSLLGTTTNEMVCRGLITPGVIALPDSRYLVYTPGYDSAVAGDVGAVTLGTGSLSGLITAQNSVIGSYPTGDGKNGDGSNLAYDASRSRILIGKHYANYITIFSAANNVGPSLSINDVVFDEGNSGTKTATFTVQLSTASAAAVTFDIGTANASATAGSDYVARQLVGQTIPAGTTSKSFSVTINGDSLPEASETFTVNLSNVAGAKTIDAQAIGKIKNDDGAAISVENISITEGNSGSKVANFKISLLEAIATPVTYNIATANGTAIAGSDYVAGILAGQSIAAGQTSQIFNVTINGDITTESDETFSVILTNVAGATIGNGVGVGTIVNDDFAELYVDEVSVAEGAAGSTKEMTFTVRLSIPSSVDVTYDITTIDSSAEADSDFVAKQLIGQVIPAGSTSKTFSVTINGDDMIEPDEALNLYVHNIVGSPTTQASPTGWILNDDGASSNPQLSISDVSITEGNNGTKLANFTVQLSSPTGVTVGYDITTVDGTASSETDFVANRLVAQRIAAGQTFKTFSVVINGDIDVESDEMFQVNVSYIIGATAGNMQATGTIVNDDTSPLMLSIADASVIEGNRGARTADFIVSLSAPAPQGGVTFNIATGSLHSTGNAATPNSDYSAVSTRVITIAAGATSTSFGVKVLGDTRVENNELFNVIVSSVSGAGIARGEAKGTIINDDNASLTNSDVDTSTENSSGITAIASIQGVGPISSMVGQQVQVQGIVTALRRDGFFLQTPDAKRNLDSVISEGIFVIAATSIAGKLAVGNSVEVAGMVRELALHSGARELTTTTLQADRVKTIATSNKLSAPIAITSAMLRPDRSITWLERYEGMRISIPKLSVVSPAGGRVDDASAVAVSDGRFYGVTNGTARPFGESGVFDGNPERLYIDTLGQIGSRAVSVDVGDEITGMVGVLIQGADSYTLLPDPSAAMQIVAGAAPRPVSVRRSSDFTIGNINARRFFDDKDDPSTNEPVLTGNAYTLRLAKTANVICAYVRNPDILGVAEVENLSTLSDIAESVNSNAGNVLFPDACKTDPGYRAVMEKGNLGFLVSNAMVRPGVPRVQVLSSIEQGRSATFRNANASSEPLFDQPPLLLRAQLNAADGGSETVTIVTNQLLPMTAADDADQSKHGWTNRTDYIRSKRRAQMQFLASLLRTRQLASIRERIVMMGGFESSEFNDGRENLLGLLTGRKTSGMRLFPMTNMTSLMPKDQRYSVVREGNAAAVDHILVNRAMLDGRYKLRTEFARINADFGEDNSGDFSVPMRVSEHDAVVLYLTRP